MKQYIKLFAILLLLGGGLTSCAEDKDYDNYDGLTYPEKVTLGCWQYNDGVTDYNVNITLNAIGDTVCNVTLVEPDEEGTMNAYTISNGLLQSYSPVTGLAEFAHQRSLWQDQEGILPCLTYVAIQRDLSTRSVQLIPYKGNNLYTDNTIAFKLTSAAKPSLCGYWTGIGETKNEDGSIEQGAQVEALLNIDGSCIYGFNGEYVEGTYTVSADGTSCDLVAADGVTLPLHLQFNAINQLTLDTETVDETTGATTKWSFILDKDAA